MADDPGLAALCLADCPMSNPAAPSSLCSLCSMQGFCSLLCILMASSSLQDCISLSQGSTTTGVAAPDSLPRLRVPEQAPDRDTKPPRGAEQHISSACKENLWGLLPNPRRAAHPASGGAKVSPGRSPAASSQGSASPKPLSAHWQPLFQVIITKKKGGQQFFSCLWQYESKNIFAYLWATFIPSLFLNLCP